MALAVYLNRGPDGKPDKFGSGQLDVLKNRHGARPTWRVNLHHETMTFEEFDHVAETSTEAATATEVAGQSGSPLDVLDGWLDDDE